jgi:hypothetical protein
MFGQRLLVFVAFDIHDVEGAHRVPRQAILVKALGLLSDVDTLEPPIQYETASALIICATCVQMESGRGLELGSC